MSPPCRRHPDWYKARVCRCCQVRAGLSLYVCGRCDPRLDRQYRRTRVFSETDQARVVGLTQEVKKPLKMKEGLNQKYKETDGAEGGDDRLRGAGALPCES